MQNLQRHTTNLAQLLFNWCREELCRPVERVLETAGGEGTDPESKAASRGGGVGAGYIVILWMTGGFKATWPKMGAAVINAPCLGCRHQNEMDEDSEWWMRTGARADKTWPMNLFYIMGCFDHWQKFRWACASVQTNKSLFPPRNLP